MKKLLIATNNSGKLAEFKMLLGDLPTELVSLTDLKIDYEVTEDGKTFQENAIKKAKEYCQISKLPSLAGDSGVEIAVLNNEPGVLTNRWFGKHLEDSEFIKAYLDKMKTIPLSKRNACMRAVFALAYPNSRKTKLFEGKIDFIIATKPYKKIIPGYPLRSLMFIPSINKYFVQLPFHEQSKFSVTGNAIKKIKQYLQKNYNYTTYAFQCCHPESASRRMKDLNEILR